MNEFILYVVPFILIYFVFFNLSLSCINEFIFGHRIYTERLEIILSYVCLFISIGISVFISCFLVFTVLDYIYKAVGIVWLKS